MAPGAADQSRATPEDTASCAAPFKHIVADPVVWSASSTTMPSGRRATLGATLGATLAVALLLHVGMGADLDNNIYPLPGGSAQRPSEIGPPYIVDVGPQRPHGQFPPGNSATDLGPQRPHGQFPPKNRASSADLGPQRPHGQFPPENSAVDLGPQRPHGQFPPGNSASAVDLGPQRPHGQFPPENSASSADLGPQRPHGQFPPGNSASAVDLGPQRPHGQFPPGNRSEEGALSDEIRGSTVDVGPHRPAGLTDPNGPKGSNGDLGPHRPQGLTDPNGPKGSNGDLSPHRPQGPTDPNGPKGSSGDLGPHRPQGLTDPNLPPESQGSSLYYQVVPADLGPQRPSGQVPPPSTQSDEHRDTLYRVYWNVPTFMCHRHGFPFDDLEKRYGIVQNEGDVFRGTRIAILYDPGLYPALVDNDGEVIVRNGGVPQEGDLELHLARLRESILEQVPEDFDGLGVIDFEAWRPVWGQNFGTLRAYQTYSVDLERQRTPRASEKALQARAQQRFETAAKKFFLYSLELAKNLRPKGRWGYYAFPYCFNNQDFQCSDNLRRQNTQIQWLFDASTALYPSVYLSKSNRSSDDQFLFIASRLQEAQRVAQGRNIVYPYLWYRYRDSGYLNDDDLRSCMTLPRALRLAGAIVWGSSGDMNTSGKCRSLDGHVNEQLGPAARKYALSEPEWRVREEVARRLAAARQTSANRG